MSVSQALATPVDDTLESSALVPRNGFHLEPRCRICRNDSVRGKVNQMLAIAAPYAGIVRALAADNAELDTRDRITLDSIRTHASKHFPVQSVAKATYRDIVERRAQENRIDFIEGVATALTPMAFFEVVMNKAFRALVDDGTEVSVETGLRAAEKLQSVLDGRELGTEVLELKVQLGWIQAAVKSTVPEEMWDEIVEKLEEFEQQHPEALDVGTDSFDDDDDEPFDPTEFAEDDDDDF